MDRRASPPSPRRGEGYPLKHIGRITRVAVLALVLGGCSGAIQIGDLGEAGGGDPEAAAGLVDRWFELARSGREEFGWWLLHPRTRDGLVGSIEVYRDALSGIDWSDFDYESGDIRMQDGRYKIDIHVTGGQATVPEPLCRWGLILFGTIDGQASAIGVMTVRVAPFGEESGILGSGGC